MSGLLEKAIEIENSEVIRLERELKFQFFNTLIILYVHVLVGDANIKNLWTLKVSIDTF